MEKTPIDEIIQRLNGTDRTVENIESKVESIKKEVDENNKRHEREITRMDKAFGMMQTTLDSVNHGINQMVVNQKETNDEIKKISTTSAEHGVKIDYLETNQNKIKEDKNANIVEKWKLMGVIITVLGGIITGLFTLF